MSSVVSKFWRVAASRWSFTGFRKNKQTHLQACSGIRNISTGPTHEKMSLGHFSFSGCSCNLRRLRAVNPGNGNVPITPLQIAPAEVHLCPPGPRPSAGLTEGLSGFKSAQFLVLSEAGPSVPWSPAHWGLGTCSMRVLGSSLSDTPLSHQASPRPGLSSHIGFLEVTGVRDQMHCEATGGKKVVLG